MSVVNGCSVRRDALVQRRGIAVPTAGPPLDFRQDLSGVPVPTASGVPAALGHQGLYSGSETWSRSCPRHVPAPHSRRPDDRRPDAPRAVQVGAEGVRSPAQLAAELPNAARLPPLRGYLAGFFDEASTRATRAERAMARVLGRDRAAGPVAVEPRRGR